MSETKKGRKENKLIDSYGRPLQNLRMAVTRECNYNCIFCHLEGDPIGKPQKVGSFPPLLYPSDYEIIAEAADKIGINGFKITGGEPLVRNDIVEIIKSIYMAASNSDISMTTNGYLLSKYAKELSEAGLQRINISIHSLKKEIYKKITGVDGLEKALQGLDEALQYNFKIKINVSVIKGLNDNEIYDLIDFASKKNIMLQLIELQPINSGANNFSDLHYPLYLIENMLIKKGAKVERRELHNRPIYILPNNVRVEIVKSYDNPIFCAGCMRVRLLADGTLIPCINWKLPGINILSAIRVKPKELAVQNAIKAFIKVNYLRRPYTLYRIDTKEFVSNGKDLRILLPKKALSNF
ncbi:MAG: GTP 3',8-cyclase MoaA [Caldisphaera sp.]|jgi:cyclic pyranopterin phosphate synthase|nr:GTP 3',8-cyclase MoaA [Caldisphaera sp.]PMP59451.1 MAG: GTP 3',8-cyclase MoaA [Caldisphaera sp.]PMP88956.1 MAG: GTP 3',8-cyclase MoaA [Caldisphaera sp.]